MHLGAAKAFPFEASDNSGNGLEYVGGRTQQSTHTGMALDTGSRGPYTGPPLDYYNFSSMSLEPPTHYPQQHGLIFADGMGWVGVPHSTAPSAPAHPGIQSPILGFSEVSLDGGSDAYRFNPANHPVHLISSPQTDILNPYEQSPRPDRASVETPLTNGLSSAPGQQVSFHQPQNVPLADPPR